MDTDHIANLLTSQPIDAPIDFEYCPDVLMITKKERPPISGGADALKHVVPFRAA